MGITRKLMSASTMGMVSFHSNKEKTARAAARSSKADKRTSKAEADLLRAQADLARAQTEALRNGDAR